MLFFALSWGVVVWVLLGEMFPNRIRAAALGVAAAAQWIANWVITVSFPTLSDWDLSGAYVIYACFAVLSIPFVVFLVRRPRARRWRRWAEAAPAARRCRGHRRRRSSGAGASAVRGRLLSPA